MILALIATLTFTLPSAGQRRWVEPDPLGDSLKMECDGGPPIHSLRSARLYWYPVTGGGYRMLLEHGVAGREGQRDSFVFDPGPGGHAYVETTNFLANDSIGVSCKGNEVWVQGSVVTGIEPPPPAPKDRIVMCRVVDVHGRAVATMSRSGVYWLVDYYASGKRVVRKKVVVK